MDAWRSRWHAKGGWQGCRCRGSAQLESVFEHHYPALLRSRWLITVVEDELLLSTRFINNYTYQLLVRVSVEGKGFHVALGLGEDQVDHRFRKGQLVVPNVSGPPWGIWTIARTLASA